MFVIWKHLKLIRTRTKSNYYRIFNNADEELMRIPIPKLREVLDLLKLEPPKELDDFLKDFDSP